MMVGIELDVDGGSVVQQCLEQNLLVNCTQGNVIRLLPAMNLTKQQANEGVDILSDVLRRLEL
jgi:acetylornithine/succinyldiaminopimelate/putrescine aminotransferase